VVVLSGCGSNPPIVMQHADTKQVIQLEDKPLICEPVMKQAGFETIKAAK
jgi:hypothetical protein